MKRSRIVLSLCGLLLAGASYGVGRWHQAQLAADQGRSKTAPGSITAASQQAPGGSDSEAPQPSQPPAAKLAEMLEQGKTGGDLARHMFAWAKENGEAAFEAFLADPRLQTQEIARQLFAGLAAKDPVAAMAMLHRLPSKSWSADAWKAVAAAWSAKDPNAAMQVGLGLEQGARRRNFLSVAYHGWLEGDPVAAAAWLKNLTAGESARSIIGKEHLFIGNMDKSNTAERMTALMEVHRLAGADQNTWLWHDFSHWSQRDPQTAMTWAMNLPADAPKRKEIMETAFERIANDPAKAQELLGTLTNEQDRQTLITKTAGAWGQSDPLSAWDWAQKLPESIREKALDQVSSSWVRTDPEAAVAYLQKHRPDQTGAWGSEAARSWGASAPDQALAWLKTVPEDIRENLTNEALQGMSREDPAKALDNLALLTDEDRRSSLLETSIRQLAQDDVTQASTHVSQMVPGAERDTAIRGLLDPAYEVEPDSALVWASSIANQSSRESLTQNYFQRWQQSDPTAAEGWLQRAKLEPTLRASLNSMIKH